MHVPSGLRVTETMSDEHSSHVMAPLTYEQTPVQCGSHTVYIPITRFQLCIDIIP